MLYLMLQRLKCNKHTVSTWCKLCVQVRLRCTLWTEAEMYGIVALMFHMKIRKMAAPVLNKWCRSSAQHCEKRAEEKRVALFFNYLKSGPQALCKDVCVCALAYTLVCVRGLNTALYCCPNHRAPKGTNKVIKVTLYCGSIDRVALYSDDVFHRRLCVCWMWVSNTSVQLLFAHEMSTRGSFSVVNACALATRHCSQWNIVVLCLQI